MESYHLTREELYDLVWSKAMRILAPELGMSDRGLAKLCRRMEIPVPGLGYWRKVELGQSAKKEKLPKASESCQTHVLFRTLINKEENEPINQDKSVIQVSEEEADPKNLIVVPPVIRKIHPLVKQTIDSIQKAASDKFDRCRPSSEMLIDICCSKKAAPRAGRILHTLIKSLEKRGQAMLVKRKRYRFYDSSYVGTFIEYNGEDIQISIMEKTTKVPHKQTKKEEQYGWSSKYDHIPNGQLVIKVENAHRYSGRRTWSDTSRRNLEDLLNTIMIDLAKVAVHLRREREKEEREQLEAERKRQYEEMLRLQRIEEQKRIEYLDTLLANWLKAKRVREFIEFAKTSQIRLSYPDMTPEEWLAWASKYANRLDPLMIGQGFELETSS